MSNAAKSQICEQLSRRSIYQRLLSTQEAAAATGLSAYELRKGAAEGRYPVILLGSPSSKFRKKRWQLAALEEAIQQQVSGIGGELS